MITSKIWMDYSSVLGPIDPQVKNKEGKYVPALGYLDKVNEMISKAQKNQLSQAEFLILGKGYRRRQEKTRGGNSKAIGRQQEMEIAWKTHQH